MGVCKECGRNWVGGEYFQHLHGKNSPQWGLKRSKSTKKKISRIHKGKTVVHTKSSRKKMSVATKRSWEKGVYDNVHMGKGRSGYREDIDLFVRSTMEANYIRYLLYKGIPFIYEPIRFNTSDGNHYTPDLWLPEKGVFVEIKGWEPKDSKQRKIRKQVAREYGVVIMMVTWATYGKIRKKYSEKIKCWELE